MSNPVRQFVKCEGCERDVQIDSPPTNDQYREGRIEIKDGMVLLNNLETHDGHAAGLGGYYCGPTCLAKRIAGLRSERKK